MKKIKYLFLSVLVCCLILPGCLPKKKLYQDAAFDYFDTVTQIYGYAYNEAEFKGVCGEIKAMLSRYHSFYDIYQDRKGITTLKAVNDSNGKWRESSGELSDAFSPEWIEVREEILDLLEFGKEMYDLTGGKTNIALGSVLSLWHEYRTEGKEKPEEAKLPPMEELQGAAAHTDIEKLLVDWEKQAVCLEDPYMLLDVGAVAKGYAVEQIAQWMLEQGYEGYVLNVGGNVRVVGERPDGKPWTIGIENPDTENDGEPIIARLSLEDMSVVTSGSYQRYYEVEGKRYHHIIDPETLMPGENFWSVSVICKDSGMGDALSTALFTMTQEEGQALIESLEEAEAMWVLPGGEKVFSAGFTDYFAAES